MTAPPTNPEALREARSWLRHLRVLSNEATPGAWQHYDQVFRAQFGRRRITEIQRAKDGKAIIAWSGFDSLDPPLIKKRNHNARFIVALVTAFRSDWFSQILAALHAATAQAERTAGELAAAEARIAELEAIVEAVADGYRPHKRCLEWTTIQIRGSILADAHRLSADRIARAALTEEIGCLGPGAGGSHERG